jgi:hypothetical protein
MAMLKGIVITAIIKQATKSQNNESWEYGPNIKVLIRKIIKPITGKMKPTFK